MNFYLTHTQSLSGTKYLLGTRTITSLNPGTTNTQKTSFKLNTNIPLGSYYIAVYADSTNKISEYNEYNNIKYSTSKITITNANLLPDLTITNIKAYPSDNDLHPWLLWVYVKNKGLTSSNPTTVAINTTEMDSSNYLSNEQYTVQIPTIDPRKIYNMSNPGEYCIEISLNYGYPKHAISIVDPNNIIKESNESNNQYQNNP